jgi:hypothetical protein
VRIRGFLLALVAGAGLVYAVGSWLRVAALAGPGGVVALLAVAGYVAIVGRATPGRVRGPLLAAAVVAAGVTAVYPQWPSGPVHEYGWLAYQPVTSPSPDVPDVAGMVDAGLVHLRWIALGLLLTAVGFAAAALAAAADSTPGRHGRPLAVVTAAVGVLMLVGVLLRWRPLVDQAWIETAGSRAGRLTDLVVAAWPGVLVAGLTATVAVLAARRGGAAGCLAAAGGLLFTIAALAVADSGVNAVPLKWFFAPSDTAFLRPGVSIGVAAGSLPGDLSAGLVAAALVAGAALLAVALTGGQRQRIG